MYMLCGGGKCACCVAVAQWLLRSVMLEGVDRRTVTLLEVARTCSQQAMRLNKLRDSTEQLACVSPTLATPLVSATNSHPHSPHLW